jgi:hypothetical protein
MMAFVFYEIIGVRLYFEAVLKLMDIIFTKKLGSLKISRFAATNFFLEQKKLAKMPPLT